MACARSGGNFFLAPNKAPTILALFCAAALSSIINPAHAQQAARAPIDPLQSEKRLQELETEQRQAKKPPPRVPQVPRQEAAGTSVPLFKLRAVSIEGARTIAPETLEAAYHPYLGRTVSQHDLEEIAAAISDIYRKAGYHLSRAIIPPQDVRTGELVVQVIEGSISDIRVTGEGGETFGVRRTLTPIARERPSRLSTVERQLLLANDTPGVRVADTALEEIAPASGEFRLIVKVETWHIGAAVALDNTGTHAVGPLQAFGAAAFNSYLLPGDSLGLAMSTVPNDTRNLRFGRAAYDVPVADGFRVGVSAAHSEVRPSDFERLTDTRTLTRSYELRGSFVPLATRETSLSFTAAFGMTDSSENEVTGTDYSDKIRTLTLLANYKLHDPLNGWNFFGLSWKQGLPVLGATHADDPMISRDGATPNFSVLGYSYSRLQPLNDVWSIKASIAGQMASGPLMISQQFFLGGAGFGPGYYSGDNGYAASAELRFDQKVDSEFLKAYQLYSFVDGGQAWNVHDGRNSLVSAGVGVRLQLAKDTQASIALAIPVSYSSQTEEFSRYRVLFSIAKAFRTCPDHPQWSCF
ncbi:MAG TPA: POTRA domain-containing protein [Pseudolabrys sp.]|nr:POTRA domain-containing protein [Pseudolabrys sp.]